MNKPVRTATADLHMSYGHFVIRDVSADLPAPRLARADGLVGTDFVNGAVVLTGIHTGPVTVTVQLLDTAPDSVDLDGWDEVGEVSVDSEYGELIVHGIMNDPPDFPELAHAGPGTYRVRVHARGRDTAPDRSVMEPVEDYLLSVWPAEEAPGTVYKQSDKRGQEYRTQG
ncbi:hypothetical protein QRX50_31750 [Amycolatopsis carbonis]|uniref:Uncharacterized protein n=1 Tax=Amycolatopsis carbonis TaxID=715471 RepID=A0A9Y2I9Y4_9PSEU|nr:hypothetical protein [Amycolatopsis sp. 2-15]WIX76034.1 hypothetical protein QRX50_31750 [Amycolatopsis sp. 2-15]